VTEIRSYRRVFDLERRIYNIDQMRLNPAGVPVRGVVYLLASIVACLLSVHVPLFGAPVQRLPWFVRDIAAPAALAAVLTVIRIDGRRFHHAARAAVSHMWGSRRVVGLSERSLTGLRWRPDDLLFLPDGSDARARRLRYTGPGTVRVFVAHRVEHSQRRSSLLVASSARGLRRGRALELRARTSLLVAPERRD
jgi:hypothetical protein